MHSGQVVCMKLIQTGEPLSDARSIVPPPSWDTTSGGAGSPMWKPAWTGSLPLRATEADGTADADGATDGEAEGAIDGATDGLGDGVGRSPPGSGPTRYKAAGTPTAPSARASRPATIVMPVFMPAEGTSTSVPGRVHWAADRMPIPWAPSSTRFANGSSRRS